MKYKIALFLIFLTLAMGVSFADASPMVYINNIPSNLSIQAAFNGDYFLPLKATVEKLGGKVTYSENTTMVYIQLKGQTATYWAEKDQIAVQLASLPNVFDFKVSDSKTYVSLSFLKRYFDVSYLYRNGTLYLYTNFQDTDDDEIEQTHSPVAFNLDHWNPQSSASGLFIKPGVIVHGGGIYKGQTVSNSLEAIENAIQEGATLIELDFLQTDDGHYILGHDWSTVRKFFDLPYGTVTHDQFMAAGNQDFTPLDMEGLIRLLTAYPEVNVVTDTKDDAMALLSYIASNYTAYLKRFYPQIYDPTDYESVRALGYDHIIYSLYKVYKTDNEVIDFSKKNELFAVTMAESRAAGTFPARLSELSIMTYVHTVNDLDSIQSFKNLGISGYYSDVFY